MIFRIPRRKAGSKRPATFLEFALFISVFVLYQASCCYSDGYTYPSSALPNALSDFVRSIAGDSHIIKMEGNASQFWVFLKFRDSSNGDICITVCETLDEAKGEFGHRVMGHPVDCFRWVTTFGDEFYIWVASSAPSARGSAELRLGLLVVTVSGSVEEMLKIMHAIDGMGTSLNLGVIRNQIKELSVARDAVTAAEAASKPILDQITKTKEAAKMVAELNNHADSEERPKLISQLVRLGDRSAVPVIIANLNPKYGPVTRERATRALGEFRDKRGIPPLVAVLEQPITGKNLDDGGPEESLRRQAITALERIGDSSIIPFLERIASNDKEYNLVKDFARDAVQRLKVKDSEKKD